MLPKQGVQVLFLFGELRCHMLCSMAKIIYRGKKSCPIVALWHNSPSRLTQYMGNVCAISNLASRSLPFSFLQVLSLFLAGWHGDDLLGALCKPHIVNGRVSVNGVKEGTWLS